MNKWATALFIIIGLFLVAVILSSLFVDKTIFDGETVAVVPINGIISNGESSSLLGTEITTPTEIIEKLETIKKEEKIKAVIIEINSPGGSAAASQEIADAIKNVNKTKYAVIKDIGTSGAYWIATSTDKIYTSQVSITGSIGVISSYLEFSGLFDKYGIKYEQLISGERKDIGTPYRELKQEEKELLQNKLKLVHEFFIKEVAKNRNLEEEYVKNLATGEFYIGLEAKELKLTDEYGNTQQVFEILKKEKNIPNAKLHYMKKEKGLLASVLETSSYNIGKGIGVSLINLEKENKIKIEV